MNFAYARIVSFSIFILIGFQSFGQSENEVSFVSGDDKIIMSGTVTIPDNETLAAVVLVSVAGPTDRDLSLGNHKYFKKLADSLAAKGIASLRYDDRGVGMSQGDLFSTALADRTIDACQAMNYLKEAFPNVSKFGFIGMSEGAGISVLTNEFCPGASFMVMLSPPVRRGVEEMKHQMKRLLATSYFTEEQQIEIEKEGHRFLELVGSENPYENKEAINELLKGKYGSVVLPPYQFVPKNHQERTEFVLSPWYQSQLNYNVETSISNNDVPTLAIYGNLDMAIDPVVNKDILRSLNDNIEIKMVDGINHLMQTANTGSPTEYIFLAESFSNKIIDLIVEWISEN